MLKNIFLYLLFMQLIIRTQSALSDPYRILGVHRSAHADEIRRAYKKLVRTFHPDKNNGPEAEAKFVEISKAYELLMNPDRREEYSKYGTTEDSPNFRQKRDYSDFRRYDSDHFASIFSNNLSSNHNNHYNNHQAFTFLRQQITAKAYQNRILPASIYSPQLILFYGDLCFACATVESVWHKITLELEPLGIGFATIHSKHESALARKIGIDELPYIIGIVDGVVRHYKESQLNLLKIVEFINRILPRNLVTQANDENYESFLSGWTDNRVRVLFVNSDKNVKLRYLTTAFYFRERVVCGHVNTKDDKSQKIISRYGIDPKMDSMLIFNEDISRPIASLAATELKPQIIRDVLHTNKFLLLPRLTSQSMFDQICPTNIARIRKLLCVMLVTDNIPSQDEEREAMRRFILENEFYEDRFRFMYIFREKQKDFINSLAIGSNVPKDPESHVVVLWRKEYNRILFEWMASKWDVSDPSNLNHSQIELFNLLNKLTQTTHALSNNARMVDLIDEEASCFLGRIMKKFFILTDRIGDNISKQDVMPFLSVLASFMFIGLIGFIMHHMMKYEEESVREQYQRIGRTPPGLKPRGECRLNVHELRGETYNGLIRLLKPGCRTIVLICDARTKTKLIPKFYRCVYPYRKNKTLMFAYFLIEKNLEWYKKLLLQSLHSYRRDLNINPKNVIGTVLAINGFKRYFCVYHVKHAEQPRRSHEDDFLDFDSEDEDDLEANTFALRRTSPSETGEIVFENNLLDGLSDWLERLFEGTTHRYNIQFWPDNMK